MYPKPHDYDACMYVHILVVFQEEESFKLVVDPFQFYSLDDTSISRLIMEGHFRNQLYCNEAIASAR